MKTSCDAIQNNVCGIYLIRNKVNNKVYIGQSVNVRRRLMEHLRSGQPEKYSIKSEKDKNNPIHQAIQKYGVENFEAKIIEKCEQSQLDEKERYWISQFNSTDKNIGYNITDGGQHNVALKGEQHSQAKLTQADVDEIISLLKNTNLSLTEISKRFNNISNTALCMINTGKTWHNNDLNYPIRKTNTGLKGEKNSQAQLTDADVMKIRQLQSEGATYATLPEEFKKKVGKSSMYNVLSGASFKHLPIWDKTNKKWIEPCIDYSLGS